MLYKKIILALGKIFNFFIIELINIGIAIKKLI